MSSGVEKVMWRERWQRERERWVGLCFQGWGLVWVSAGGSDPERQDLGRELERGKGKGKEGQCWVVELLKDLQGWAGPCADLGEHVGHVGPWQWVELGHLEVH